MKLQDVILKAMAKKISWMDAAEIAGMSVRIRNMGTRGCLISGEGSEAYTAWGWRQRRKCWSCTRRRTLT